MKALLPEGTKLEADAVSTGSSYFEVRGRLRIDDVVIEEHSIVVRQGREVRTLQRERGPSQAPAATGIKR